jgi:hypothetical protein
MTILNNNSSDDTITITVDPSDSYTGTIIGGTFITGSNEFSSTDFGNITISNGGGGYTIGTGFNWHAVETIPFDTGFPEWEDFQNMCEEYPALKIAYEHMKVFYKLSKDDWESKKKGEDV